MRNVHRTIPLGLPALALAGWSCSEIVVDYPPPMAILGSYSETGRHAQLAGEMARGYGLAVEMFDEKVAASLELKLFLNLFDDQSDAEVAAELYTGFGRTVALGPFSSPITEAVLAVTEEEGMPLVAPMAAAPGIWAGRSRRWSVQMLNPAPTYLQGSVEIAARSGATTLALVYEETEFPASVAEGVREAALANGIDVVMDRSYPAGQADHEALVIAARDAGLDVFIGGTYYADAVEFTKAVAAVGYEPMLVSLSLGPGEPDFVDDVGESARCVVGNAPWTPALRTSGFIADNQTFVERYQAKYGSLPGYHAAAGFSAVELLVAARAAITDQSWVDLEAMRNHLFRTSTETILGPFQVAPLDHPDAGAQQALQGLQVQWQDDGAGGLAPRIIHPPSMAEADPCFLR